MLLERLQGKKKSRSYHVLFRHKCVSNKCYLLFFYAEIEVLFIKSKDITIHAIYTQFYAPTSRPAAPLGETKISQLLTYTGGEA